MSRTGSTTCIAVAALIHAAIVLSIARQPLDVNRADPAERSAVWALCHDSVHRMGPGADLFAVVHAGVQLAAGDNPYTASESVRHTPYFYRFRYLPVVGHVLGRPLARLAPRTAWWLWLGVVELLLIATGAMLLPLLTRPGLQAAGASVLLLSTPYFLELHMGQFTYAATALTLLAIAPIARADRGTASRVVATVAYPAAVLLKLFPAVAAPALLFDRSGRRIVAAAAGLTVAALGLLAAAPDRLRYFVAFNFSSSLDGMHTGNMSPLFLLHQLGTDFGLTWTAHNWRWPSAALAVLLLGGTAGWVHHRRPAPLLAGAALLLAHLLSYPHVWEHHLSAAVPLGLVVVAARTDTSGRLDRWGRTALVATIAIGLPTPFFWIDSLDPTVADAATGWPPVMGYAIPLCKIVPTVVLYAIALVARSPGSPTTVGGDARPGA